MPLFHIHGLSTFFATLVSGGSYVSMSGFSPESFFACLEEFRPTWYSASPAIHRAILDSAQSYRSNSAAECLALHSLSFGVDAGAIDRGY